jgi:hypothetical protein
MTKSLLTNLYDKQMTLKINVKLMFVFGHLGFDGILRIPKIITFKKIKDY